MKTTRAAGLLRLSTICLVVLVSMLLFAVGANAADTTAPTVNSLTLSQTSITAQGTIAVTLDITDDLSGVQSVYADFSNTVYSNSTLYCNFEYNQAYNEQTGKIVYYYDGKWHGFIKVDQYTKPGSYILDQLTASDQAQNQLIYVKNYMNTDLLPEKVKSTSFMVAGEHTHVYDSGKVTKNATCGAEGVKTYTCKVCGATKTEAIAKTTTHTWNSGKLTTPMTASQNGLVTYTCKVCGTTKTVVLPAGGSTFADVQDSGVYYYEPVLWAVDNGITAGTSSFEFSPNENCTRGQVVTFLYRDLH